MSIEFKEGDTVFTTVSEVSSFDGKGEYYFCQGDIGIVKDIFSGGVLVNFNGQGNENVLHDGFWMVGLDKMQHLKDLKVIGETV